MDLRAWWKGEHLIWVTGFFLLTIASIADWGLSSQPRTTKAAKVLEDWLEERTQQAEAILEDTLLDVIIDSREDIFQYFKEVKLPDYTEIILYQPDGDLYYWSDNKVVPPKPESILQPGMRMLKLNNAFHLANFYQLEKGYMALILVTVYTSYPATNRFLQNGFSCKKPVLEGLAISTREEEPHAGRGVVHSPSGEVLFSIKTGNETMGAAPMWIIVLELLGLSLLFMYANRQLRNFLRRRQLIPALAIMTGVALLAELFIGVWQWPAFTRGNIVFSSSAYASPFLGETLGILLTRVAVLHWILQHAVKYMMGSVRLLPDKRQVALGVILSAAFYTVVFVVSSLHHHSNISFDLYDINLLDLNSLIGILIMALSVSMLYLPFKYMKPGFMDRSFYWSMVPVHLVGITLGVAFDSFEHGYFVLAILAWFLIYVRLMHFLLFKRTFYEQYKFFSNLALTSLFALLGAICLLYFSFDRRTEMLQRKVVELASERDLVEEYKISEIAAEIATDNFIKNYYSAPYMSSFDIDRRIQFRYYASFLGKYNIYTHTYNADGLVLRGESARSLFELQSLMKQEGVQEPHPHLYYLSVKSKGEKYLVFFDILQDSVLMGYLGIEFVPKVFTTYSAYPELLRSDKSTALEDLGQNAYAVYSNGKLVRTMGNYAYRENFDFSLPAPGSFVAEFKNGYRHIVYSTGDKYVVYSDKAQTLTSTISLFSYLLLFLLIFFLLSDLVGLYKDFGGDYSIKSIFSPNTLQKQIQSAMILIVLFSLVMVAVITLYYFTVQYNSFHNDRLLQRGNSVLSSLQLYYNDEKAQGDEAALETVVVQRLKQLRDVFELDINAFSTEGQLMMSTQPEIFKRGLIAPWMHPRAFEALRLEGKSQFMQEERIGNLSFISAYLPFRDEAGEIKAFVSFPYFGKQRSIRQDVSYFLVVLVNIYVFMILGAALMSILLSRSITKPLQIVTEAISKVELGRKGQRIEWRNQDEIGLLVKEYNRMIEELEESAMLLARSEREGAWREMAKQVAHEIKNPLTPMKLSIQHLQRAIQEDRPDIHEMTRRVASRLIEQIETLSNIATAFSDFARMPLGTFARVDIADTLRSVSDLFESDEELNIETDIPDSPCMVYADKDQLIRVFNNLLKNALQSIPETRTGQIKVSLQSDGKVCKVSVADNGAGIPPDKADAVFEPNFTTKSSGTGLGLAMSKSIVEAAGGQIWFENNEPQGTIFFVQLNIRKE
jgi:two-component system, NtrC family, nitrogen regulation sensor histidine kinase NtrY